MPFLISSKILSDKEPQLLDSCGSPTRASSEATVKTWSLRLDRCLHNTIGGSGVCKHFAKGDKYKTNKY